MLKYIARRLLEVIPTTFGIILLTFVLFNVVGGSPAQVILGKNATAESIAAFNHKYGYDLPLPKQFVKFCNDLAHGDFGISTEQGGLYLNEGLSSQKFRMGGRGIVYNTYEIKLDN